MKLTIRTFIVLLILSLCCLSNAQHRRLNSLFVVIVDDKRGYIDQNGKIVINPQFEGASDFSEELAVISTSKNGYSVPRAVASVACGNGFLGRVTLVTARGTDRLTRCLG